MEMEAVAVLEIRFHVLFGQAFLFCVWLLPSHPHRPCMSRKHPLLSISMFLSTLGRTHRHRLMIIVFSWDFIIRWNCHHGSEIAKLIFRV